MGGKSRKSGGVSKALINRIVVDGKKGKCGGKSKTKKRNGSSDLFQDDETK